MAKTKSKKAPGKLSKALRAFNPRSFRGGMALFALVFALTGGGYMLYRSFAATLPAYRTGYMDWRLQSGGKYSPSFTTDTSAGVVCIASNFNSYNGFSVRYHWYIQVYEGGQWTQVRQSGEMQANGNRDWHCYDDGIYKSKIYRVKFDPEARTYMHGTYWIWGHNHN